MRAYAGGGELREARLATNANVLALGLILAARLVGLLMPVAFKKIVDGLGTQPGLLAVPVALLLAYGTARIGVTVFTELRQVVLIEAFRRRSDRRGAAAVHF